MLKAQPHASWLSRELSAHSRWGRDESCFLQPPARRTGSMERPAPRETQPPALLQLLLMGHILPPQYRCQGQAGPCREGVPPPQSLPATSHRCCLVSSTVGDVPAVSQGLERSRCSARCTATKVPNAMSQC
ncbi:unnamed protein product [Arctogadus glacialis]